MTSRLALLVSLLGTGCTVASLDEFKLADVKNSCSEDSDCADGFCQSGQCRATQGAFDTLLLEVTAPATSPQVAGLRYLRRLEVSTTGGEQNVDLQIATVTGTLTPEFDPMTMSCNYNRVLSPIKLVFTPSDRLLGISAQSHSATATWGEYGYNFIINIPPGEYDIYAESSVPADASQCPVAPQLYRRMSIGAGPLSLPLPLPKKLTVKIEAPAQSHQFSGWTADMIDPVTSKVLSTTDSSWERIGVHLVAELYYSPAYPPPVPPEQDGNEQIRLTPAAGVVAPTLHFVRNGIEIGIPGEAVVSQLPLLPPPVDVQGEVVGCVEPGPDLTCNIAPVPARVKIAALELEGFDRGVFASYEQTATADEEGKFVVKLLPGTYRVIASPPLASKLAAVELAESRAWTVSGKQDFQAGRIIELAPAVDLTGVVMDPARARPMTGATVQALASPASLTLNAFDEAQGDLVFVPTASTAVVGGLDSDGRPIGTEGGFELLADPGVYDVSVRPRQTTGFAWLVMPNVRATAPRDLGVISMPLPIEYRGVVTAPVDAETVKPVPGAVVRAYVYMVSDEVTSDRKMAKSVLQIAETRADDDGKFELLVPAALTKSP